MKLTIDIQLDRQSRSKIQLFALCRVLPHWMDLSCLQISTMACLFENYDKNIMQLFLTSCEVFRISTIPSGASFITWGQYLGPQTRMLLSCNRISLFKLSSLLAVPPGLNLCTFHILPKILKKNRNGGDYMWSHIIHDQSWLRKTRKESWKNWSTLGTL